MVWYVAMKGKYGKTRNNNIYFSHQDSWQKEMNPKCTVFNSRDEAVAFGKSFFTRFNDWFVVEGERVTQEWETSTIYSETNINLDGSIIETQIII